MDQKSSSGTLANNKINETKCAQSQRTSNTIFSLITGNLECHSQLNHREPGMPYSREDNLLIEYEDIEMFFRRKVTLTLQLPFFSFSVVCVGVFAHVWMCMHMDDSD